MRGWLLLSTIAACVGLSGGCFRQVQEQVTEDSASYLVIQGSGEPVSFQVDGAVVANDVELVEENGIRFKVGPGSHQVRVVRGENVLVDRKIYVGDGETRIITVPRS
jgi:hypothetical protein